jgi:hypothetical protein
MKKKDKIKFEYPTSESWFDFSEGLVINNEEINEWVKEVVKQLKHKIKSGKKRGNYHIATGNSIVWGIIYQVSKNSNKYEILIRVAKNYSELSETVKIGSKKKKDKNIYNLF